MAEPRGDLGWWDPADPFRVATALLAAAAAVVAGIVLGLALVPHLPTARALDPGAQMPMVQHRPTVHLIFWGPRWRSDTSGVRTAAVRLFRSLPGSGYQEILGGYRDDRGRISDDVRLAGVWLDDRSAPPATFVLTRPGPLLREVVKAIRLHGWDHGRDSQFMVFLQQGTELYDPSTGPFAETCGFHTWGRTEIGPIAVSAVKYVGGVSAPTACRRGPGDDGGTTATSMTAIASHEYAETAANLRPHALVPQHREIADRCAGEGFWLRPGVWVQKLWDRRAGRCAARAAPA